MDIYSLGVTLFAMVTRTMPFASLSYLKQGDFVISRDPLYRAFISQKDRYWDRYADYNLSPEFKEFVSLMLDPNPTMRPTVAMLITHKWLSEGVASDEEYQADIEARI